MTRATYHPCGCYTHIGDSGHTEKHMCARHAMEAANEYRRAQQARRMQLLAKALTKALQEGDWDRTH